jgi:IS1 family transposase
MLLWVSEVPVTAAAELVGITTPTSIQWYQYFRDICSFKVLDAASVNQLGGPGHIVEIDESLFFKRKYNVGHNVEKHWIFGAYDLTTKKGYLTRVEDRTANTLVPLIQTWVAPGSTIHSDQWASYTSLSNLGYIHSTVNHTTNFVDPETGATINHVESFWCRMKRKLKFVFGSQGDMKWSRLDEAVYREYYDFKNKDLWHNFNMFLGHINDRYPL